ncbi:MAG: hypothetical protein LBQ87_06235 [Candidatus Fibromonas sp.]|jgi:hypothetical protein|nr:hypothetical protein [Candidatus Fibromonas sp.]
MGFWRKWNMLCMMFIVSCLLAIRLYREVPGAVDSAEKLMWVGGGGLLVGFIMLFLQNRKK